MKRSDIAGLRLERQHVGGMEFIFPKAIVAWMGAIQAQDFPMAKWAIGVRLPGMTEKLVEAAISKGDILRTHLLRPTWHFVAADDIFWLLDLTAPQIKTSQKARDKQLELTAEVYTRSNNVIGKTLSTYGQLSREELVAELNRAGIATDQNRAAHLLMHAELDKIICSGTVLRGKPTYALLAERVSKPMLLAKEEALAELARRYFTSRCPATLQDFTWWSGLSAQDARQALELIKSKFIPEEINGRTYWLTQDIVTLNPAQPTGYLLPTYDELIISYADRSASISPELEHHMKDISDRGVFWPVIVVNGKVTGIWKRTIRKDAMQVEIQPFSKLNPTSLARIEQAASDFAAFWDKKLCLIPFSPTD